VLRLTLEETLSFVSAETPKLVILLCNQKSLKIPKGLSESVYRRRTDRKGFTYIILYHIFRILMQLENKQFTCYMWLEDWLTSSQQHFSYIEDEINNTKYRIEMRDWGDRWLTIKMILDCHCKHMECWLVTNKKVWRYQQVIRGRKSKKDIQGSGHKKNKTKGQTMNHKTLHRNQTIEQHEPY